MELATRRTVRGRNRVLVQPPAGAVTTLVWDPADRLSVQKLPNGSIVTHTYRFDNLRYGRQGPNGTDGQLWDGSALVGWSRKDNSGSTDNQPAQAFTGAADAPELGRALGTQTGSGLERQYHTDEQGTVLAITDDSQTTAVTYQTDPFGNVRSGSATDQPLDYAGGLGYQRDPDAGTMYVRARHYDPTTGEWLSADPIEGEPPYAYGYNSPTVFTDPSGMQGTQPRITEGMINAWIINQIQPGGLPYLKLLEMVGGSPAQWDKMLEHYTGNGPAIMRILAARIQADPKRMLQLFVARDAEELGMELIATGAPRGKPSQKTVTPTYEYRTPPGLEHAVLSGPSGFVPPMEKRRIVEGRPPGPWEPANVGNEPGLGDFLLTDTEVGRGLSAMAEDKDNPLQAVVGALGVDVVKMLNPGDVALTISMGGLYKAGRVGKIIVGGLSAAGGGAQAYRGYGEATGGNPGAGLAHMAEGTVFIGVGAFAGYKGVHGEAPQSVARARPNTTVLSRQPQISNGSARSVARLFVVDAAPRGMSKPRPVDIVTELQKSGVGQETIALLKHKRPRIVLTFQDPTPMEAPGQVANGFYDENTNTITTFMVRTRTVVRTAQNVIHETTHTVIRGSQRAEMIAKFRAHKHVRELSPSDALAIGHAVKRLYGDRPWEIGMTGFGTKW